MALEPRTVTLEEGPNPELVDMSRRFWVGLVLSLPIFLLAMGDMLPGQPLHHLLSMTSLNWVQLAPGDARGLLVRLAVLRAGLGFGRPPQPEYVHPDRPGRRGRLSLQPGRHGRP